MFENFKRRNHQHQWSKVQEFTIRGEINAITKSLKIKLSSPTEKFINRSPYIVSSSICCLIDMLRDRYMPLYSFFLLYIKLFNYIGYINSLPTHFRLVLKASPSAITKLVGNNDTYFSKYLLLLDISTY